MTLLPTIQELNKTIKEMRKTYDFKDDDTRIELNENPNDYRCTVELHTKDNKTQTEINLTKTIEYENIKFWGRYEMYLDGLRLSQILESIKMIKYPSEYDKTCKIRIERAISDYGDITYKEYQEKRYEEIKDMSDAELDEFKKYIPNDENCTDFTKEMMDSGMVAPFYN